ncbi:tetratricopeptide repeat protein [bacterium]|nr:tetratricopeptide repeat protein [bacterium]
MKRATIILSLLLIVLMVMVTGCNHPAITSARIYLNNNQDPDKAIEQCKIAINEVPANPEPHFLMGQAYIMKKMYKEMNDSFTKCLEVGPAFTEKIAQERNIQWSKLLNAGVVLYQAEKTDEAAEKFKLCTSIMPEKQMAYKYLGSSCAQNDDPDNAILAFMKAVELDNEDIESKYQLANLYYSTKAYEKAITSYNDIVDNAGVASKYYGESLSRAGICYDILGKPEEAQKIYETAIAQNPENMDLRYNLGRIFIRQDNWEKAVEMLEPVYNVNADNYENCLSYGVSLAGLGKFAEAVPVLKKATELDPTKHDAWFWLGTSYVRSGDSANGQIAFDKADELKAK